MSAQWSDWLREPLPVQPEPVVKPNGVPWSLGAMNLLPDSGPFWPEPPVDPATLIDTECCQ